MTSKAAPEAGDLPSQVTDAAAPPLDLDPPAGAAEKARAVLARAARARAAEPRRP